MTQGFIKKSHFFTPGKKNYFMSNIFCYTWYNSDILFYITHIIIISHGWVRTAYNIILRVLNKYTSTVFCMIPVKKAKPK